MFRFAAAFSIVASLANASPALAHGEWDTDHEVVIVHPERRIVERYFYAPRPYYTPAPTRSYHPTLGRYYGLVGERRYLQRYDFRPGRPYRRRHERW